MGWTSGFVEIMEISSADASEITCKHLLFITQLSL